MSTTSLQKWTEPKLSTSGKKWFVWFRFYDETTKRWKPIKRKGERIEKLKALREAIIYKLEKLDWDPITDTCKQEEDELSVSASPKLVSLRVD